MHNKFGRIKERVLLVADYKGIPRSIFCKEIGSSYGNFTSKNKETPLNSNVVANILSTYRDINPNWLLTGEGDMLNRDENKCPNSKYNKVPFWNLPVSAGKSIDEITGSIEPDGYLAGLPGLDNADHVLPVVGSSMEPEIPNGSIIGIKSLSNFDSLNTQRIYLIITREDRMIKRIEHDPNDSEILWCISPNYPRFSINKEDIIEIHVVCFVYEPQ